MTSQAVDVLPEATRPDTHKPLALSGGLNLDEIKSIGQVFLQSGMFKDTKSAAQAITKILAGQELGIPPLQAMTGVHIVDGQPRLSASLVGALVKRSGRYDFRPREVTSERAVIDWYQDREKVGDSEFSIDEARAAGLAARSNWKTYAQDMLFARALTRGARRYCPDVFGGAVYTLGEDAPDAELRPDQFVAQTGPRPPLGTDDYVPPRRATLHDDPVEPELFPPSQDELDREAAAHKDPTDD